MLILGDIFSIPDYIALLRYYPAPLRLLQKAIVMALFQKDNSVSAKVWSACTATTSHQRRFLGKNLPLYVRGLKNPFRITDPFARLIQGVLYRVVISQKCCENHDS